MKLVNEPPRDFVKCEVCGELVGVSSPAIEMSYGYCGDDGSFWVDESIMAHYDCIESELLERLLHKLEKN